MLLALIPESVSAVYVVGQCGTTEPGDFNKNMVRPS